MTRLLVADRGNQHDDFCWAIPGEVVYPDFVCDRDITGDGGCGCARAFIGVTSGHATTCATVADLDITPDQLGELFADIARRKQWTPGLADQMTAEVLDLAADWPEGTPIRRWLDHYQRG